MRIGMVCPYSFDVPGGVQSHVLQLAEVMRARGHEVSVLAPVSPHASLPDYVVSAGKAVPIPYNGSVARLRFGPATHRKVKKWLVEGDFDVLHLHEPNAPEPVDVGPEHRRGADRGDVSHLDHQIADPDGLPGHPAADAREDRRPDRGVRPGPALADGGAGNRRGGDPQRGRRRFVRLGAAAGRISAAGQDGAVPGPLRRAPQGHGGAARRAATRGRALSRTCSC